VQGIVRVLVIDDSAYARKLLREMLSRSPLIEVVGAARDGEEALEMAAELKPDVITCDITMPGMDGVAFVRAQMARRSVPIVMISVADGNGERVLSAFDAGAVDFMQKPTALADERLFDIAEELLAKVKAAAMVPMARIQPVAETAARAAAPAFSSTTGRFSVVVVGISTGGPQGLKMLIPAFPATCPVPIVVVLHMPVGYTELYAQKLNELSALTVVEACEGTPVAPGMVLIAPAGRHLTFRREGDGGVVAHLDVRPLGMLHRPAVDVLFRSAAEVYGERVLAVVMTGMGSDGREGAAWVKAKGGIVLTEAEESCVVYGMPRSVVEAGLSDESVSLERLAPSIVRRL